MNIAPVSAVGIPGVGLDPTRSATTIGAAGDSSGGSFGDVISNAVDALNESHAEADRLAVQAATGDLNAVHDYTIAATEAQLLTQLTVEVRNRAVEAFNDIMRMQV